MATFKTAKVKNKEKNAKNGLKKFLDQKKGKVGLTINQKNYKIQKKLAHAERGKHTQDKTIKTRLFFYDFFNVRFLDLLVSELPKYLFF